MTGVQSRDDAIVRLMQVNDAQRDLEWIKDSLQAAIALEAATIPPYLCGYWSIRNRSVGEVPRLIRSIVVEEMAHMGLACNMLNTIGGTPSIVAGVAAVRYPGPLPGGVRPELVVDLAGLSKPQVQMFMEIEKPDQPLALLAETFTSIGDFYHALLEAFQTVRPPISGQKQLTPLGGAVFPINNLNDVERAINVIVLQGEGTTAEPDPGGEMAHYYEFGEIYHERRIVQNPTTKAWEYTGDPVPFPTEIYPMAPLPEGGWPNPPQQVQTRLDTFNDLYTGMLEDLEAAWVDGDQGRLGGAIGKMFNLANPAVELMQIPYQDQQTYGPDFRVIR